MDPALSENRRRRGSIGANTGTDGSELKKAASPARAAARRSAEARRAARSAAVASSAVGARRGDRSGDLPVLAPILPRRRLFSLSGGSIAPPEACQGVAAC